MNDSKTATKSELSYQINSNNTCQYDQSQDSNKLNSSKLYPDSTIFGK